MTARWGTGRLAVPSIRSRRLRHQDRGHWAATALRRTWVSAAVLVTFMAVVGFALQQSTPDAVSAGDVVRRVLAR